MSESFRNDDYCIVCGEKNPIGLHLDIKRDERGKAWARVNLPKEFQGYTGIAHGGIVVTLLDEMMVHALWAMGIPNVTAQIKVRFRKPVPIQTPLEVSGEVIGKKSKMYQAFGLLKNREGIVLAEGESLLAPIDQGK